MEVIDLAVQPYNLQASQSINVHGCRGELEAVSRLFFSRGVIATHSVLDQGTQGTIKARQAASMRNTCLSSSLNIERHRPRGGVGSSSAVQNLGRETQLQCT